MQLDPFRPEPQLEGPFPPSGVLEDRPLPCAHEASHRGFPAMPPSTALAAHHAPSTAGWPARRDGCISWLLERTRCGRRLRGAPGSGCCLPSPDPGPPWLSPHQAAGSLLPHSPASLRSPPVPTELLLLRPRNPPPASCAPPGGSWGRALLLPSSSGVAITPQAGS